jgi:hypothetical protein
LQKSFDQSDPITLFRMAESSFAEEKQAYPVEGQRQQEVGRQHRDQHLTELERAEGSFLDWSYCGLG